MYIDRNIEEANESSVSGCKGPGEERIPLIRSLATLVVLSIGCWAGIIYVITRI